MNIQQKRAIAKHEKYCKATIGAFTGLLNQSEKINVNSSFSTFAVSANFNWFPVMTILQETKLVHIMNRLFSMYEREYEKDNNKTTYLFLPSVKILNKCPISLKVMVGGGLHELGHKVMDTGDDISFEEFKNFFLELDSKYGAVFNDSDFRRTLRSKLKRWCNVFADIRLERALCRKSDIAMDRLSHSQEWVWSLEADVRKFQAQKMLQSVVRDLGKNINSESKEKVFSEYDSELIELGKYILSMSDNFTQLVNSDWDNPSPSAHLPLICAIETLVFLHEQQIEEDDSDDDDHTDTNPQPQQQDDEDDTIYLDDSDSEDSDNEDDSNEDDSEGEDSEGEDSEGEDSDNKDSEGEDSDNKDSEGEESDGEDSDNKDSDGEDSDNKDSDGNESDDKDSDNKDSDNKDSSTGQGQTPPSIDKNKLSDIDNEDALDPSSAMDKLKEENMSYSERHQKSLSVVFSDYPFPKG